MMSHTLPEDFAVPGKGRLLMGAIKDCSQWLPLQLKGLFVEIRPD